jgi:hypothetical protein
MFLSSEKGKRFLNFLYSWGAAIVIIGALFKLLHLPYANQILFIAMITEACVFFISAFERPTSDYHWEEVFPVLTSKNPLDRPDFSGSGEGGSGGGVVSGGSAGGGSGGGVGGGLGGGSVIIGGGFPGGDSAEGGSAGEGQSGGVAYGGSPGGGPGGTIIVGDLSGLGKLEGQQGGAPGGVIATAQPQRPSPQSLVNAGMATMGLNISEEDAEVLAESIKKLNSAAEQIAKMADLTEATQSYIDQISTVTQNLEKVGTITASLGEVSDTLINSCKAITGMTDESAEEKTEGYVERMSKLNDNLSGLNQFYESQLNGLRSQMDTIAHINAGLNRIRDMYESSMVDSAAFRNENERMAQLLAQLNHVYGRLLQAMTVNMQAGAGYVAPPPPYQGGGFR